MGLRSLIRAFTVHLRIASKNFANAQDGLHLRILQTFEGTFSLDETKITDIQNFITKTYLYNFDPLNPHFYIVKLGSQGYTLSFLFLLKNINCGYSLEPPRRGGSNEYPQSMFRAEI